MIFNNNYSFKILAVIAEYNPFHNGHFYHLQKSKELTGANFTIAIMSGNFTQRAEPAIIDKWKRAEIAIKNGVDLVIELPTVFATSAAEDFAFGAISILKELNIVDFLSFGCKNAEISDLEIIADIFIDQPEDFVFYLNNYLANGISYPKALSNALYEYTGTNKFVEILNEPNNVLGIEYIKQMKSQNFPVTAISINRFGELHSSIELTPFASRNSNQKFNKNE